MANLTLYDPFDVTFEPFDDLFKGFFRPVRMEGMEGVSQMQIKMDVKENDKSYTVHADIPGVKKEDIHVTIDGNQACTHVAYATSEVITIYPMVLRSERYYGKVARSLTLGSEIDEGASEAKYDNGVLELVLPKKTSTPSKKLEVK